MKTKLTLLLIAVLISTLGYTQKIRISTAYKIGDIDSTGKKCAYPKEKVACDVSIIEDEDEDGKFIYFRNNGGGDSMIIVATIDSIAHENQISPRDSSISSRYYCTDVTNSDKEECQLIRAVFKTGEEQIIVVYETQAYLFFVYKEDQESIDIINR